MKQLLVIKCIFLYSENLSEHTLCPSQEKIHVQILLCCGMFELLRLNLEQLDTLEMKKASFSFKCFCVYLFTMIRLHHCMKRTEIRKQQHRLLISVVFHFTNLLMNIHPPVILWWLDLSPAASSCLPVLYNMLFCLLFLGLQPSWSRRSVTPGLLLRLSCSVRLCQLLSPGSC